VDEWYERYDDEGECVYYWNAASEESSWECPEWVEEIDPATQATYYIRLDTNTAAPLMSTWDKPAQYARLYRRCEE
jgi:hypothetical protein